MRIPTISFYLASWLASVLAAPAAEPTVEEKDLPRVPPTAPQDALKTFRVKPGFHMELVAAEPQVVSPVAMCFDENGRLFVAEMIDYSERREEHLGRIRLLEDTNGDGRMDKSTVFAKDLSWPTALFWANGGLFVGATPDLYFFKDTDGDGMADEKKVVFTGFGSTAVRLNVQQLFNSLNWGLDNRIHGAIGGNGGVIRSLADPARPPLNLGTRDFSFDPRTLELEPETGGGQHGLSFDNYGRKFVCSNSSHIMQVMYEERYVDANPLFPPPRAAAEIPVDGGAAEVYRLSPDEPWRVIRTKWRVSGLVPGPIEGGGRPSGYFTGATGVTIYRGDAFPEEYLDDAFVADCGSNLIHHKKLHPNGVEFKAERASNEQKVEFIASTDNWFRPVQFANAPDGTLYVADMYREVIEHPWSLPPNLKKYLDLNSGNDRGRIYRIVPDGFKQRPLPRLGKASTDELVKTLEHPNGWYRDTAARLLYERQDKTAIPTLRGLAGKSKSQYGRLHALYSLAGLNALRAEELIVALNDANAGVRENAIRLADMRYSAGRQMPVELWNQLLRLAHDPQVRVRCQLAWTLGICELPNSVPPEARTKILADLLRASTDKWEQIACLVSAGAEPQKAWLSLMTDPPKDLSVLQTVTTLVGADKKSDPRQILARISSEQSNKSIPLAAALDKGLRQRGTSLARIGDPNSLNALSARAKEIIHEEAAPEKDKLAATALLGIKFSPENAQELARIISPEKSSELQNAAIDALAQFDRGESVNLVLDRWKSMTPQTRQHALDAFLTHPNELKALLEAVDGKKIAASNFSVAQVAQIRKSPDLRALAEKVFGKQDTSSRPALVAKYSDALRLEGHSEHGKQLYLERCASCHRLAGQGTAVGPDLESVRQAGKETLLANILDPNREVATRYVAYDLETKSGESFTGIIANESGSTLLIRGANNFERSLQRDAILRLENSGKSLMPEGLEQGLAPQDIADLLEYLLHG
jgi:putative membrane-bound dehydrogenase-like protein